MVVALLLLGGAAALWWYQPWVKKPVPPPVVVNPNPPGPVTPPVPPVVLPPVPPGTLPPPVEPCPTGTVRSVDAPKFSLPYLHNQVRQRTTEYIVTYQPDCRGASIECWSEDSSGTRLLLNKQEYGPNLAFNQQWIITYSQFGNYVWVDQFKAPNLFVGRSVYEYDSAGKTIRLRRLDGHQRMLTRVTVERGSDEALGQITYERFNQFGVAIEVRQLTSLDDPAVTGEFFMFDQFGRK